ncbi:NAD(P)-dependent alcohol dehydrogenase [Devosia sp.]|uniref:NAD(P)-dependent alcohol dehydrogenase n=1 Tax=Devosia sp. TaxID=1871048 RepID=UPI003A91E5D3
MDAVIARRYGGPEVLEIGSVPTPTPKDNEVLVKIHASAVTQADVMMRTGTPHFARLFVGLRGPKAKIPGTSFAGKVVAKGAGVTRYAVGDDVFGETTLGFSTHAQFVAVAETGVIQHVPHNMSYLEAAPVTDGALTVHNFLTRLASIKPGQKVLINGAAGGLGTFAVQYARHFGAEVTGVASTRNADLVREMGADHFIDYTKTDVTRGAERYDLIFDTVGKLGFSKARRVLTPDGVYLSPVLGLPMLIQMLWTSRFSRRKGRFAATGLLPHDQLSTMLGEVKALIEAGSIWTHIDRTYPMSEIVDAHRYVEAGHKRGAVVLEMAHRALADTPRAVEVAVR